MLAGVSQLVGMDVEDVGVAGGAGMGEMQVASGVRQDLALLDGEVFILAEELPTWALLLHGRTEQPVSVLTVQPCAWFVSALRLHCQVRSGSLRSDWAAELPWRRHGHHCRATTLFKVDVLSASQLWQRWNLSCVSMMSS